MSLSTQFYTMLAMIGMGSFFGASLDTYQRFIQRGKRKKYIVFINDLLFWVVQGVLIFYVLYQVNYGEIRFYLLLALLCGFSAYQAILKNVYLKILEKLIHFIKQMFTVSMNLGRLFIYRPIQALILFLISVVVFIGRVLLFLVKRVGIMLLWIIQILVYPFTWIGKKLFLLLPHSWRQKIHHFFQTVRKWLANLKGGGKKE